MRRIIKKQLLSSKFLRRLCVAYCVNNNLLPEVLVRTPADQLRELLLLPEATHHAQLNQDIFALIACRFRSGYFVEIGANDGFTLSNTLYLEQKFGWEGLLVEANPQYEESLGRRRARIAIAAVVEKEGYYEFSSAGLFGGITKTLGSTHHKKTKNSESITVWGATLESILEENGSPQVIHFISIDVEGAEISIVEQMCRSERYSFWCGCIEHNSRVSDYSKIVALLQGAGYRIIWPNQTGHDLFFVNESCPTLYD